MVFRHKLYYILTLLLFSQCAFSATVQPGSIFISEVMANPLATSDTNGEWFELFNASASTIDLNGLIISDDNSNFHEINHNDSLFILPGEYLVLGRNSDITVNGGYTADYVYTGFSLGNTSDQIVLSSADSEIVRLNYNGLPFGIAGVSAELIAQVINPDVTHYQLTENFIYGAGDNGTPGAQGSFELNYANPVPIPGALWLFISAIFLLGRNLKTTQANVFSQRCFSHYRYNPANF